MGGDGQREVLGSEGVRRQQHLCSRIARLTFHCGGVVSGCELEKRIESELQRKFELLEMGHARWG